MAAVETVRRWFREREIVIEKSDAMRSELLRFEERITPNGYLTYGARRLGFAARTAPRKGRARQQATGRLMMAVARSRRGRGGIVDSADHVNVAAKRGQR